MEWLIITDKEPKVGQLVVGRTATKQITMIKRRRLGNGKGKVVWCDPTMPMKQENQPTEYYPIPE